MTTSPSSLSVESFDVRVGSRYRLTTKVGSGSFGDIYIGEDVRSGQKVGVKLESVKNKHPQLFYESKVYRLLAGALGIPEILSYTIEGDFNILVMELLGPSLEDLFSSCGRRFSLKTVLMLADQLIRRMEYVHSKNFLHRDVKPDNFLMGLGDKRHVLYLIDFGLAKKYSDSRSMRHISYRQNKQLTGTARYASINTHIGLEQSRRDDLESLGYMLLYFLRGALPWQGLKAETKTEKYRKITECKMSTSVASLCKGFPNQFLLYLEYCRSLAFETRPDYRYLRSMFRSLFIELNYEFDFQYDWVSFSLNTPPPNPLALPASVSSFTAAAMNESRARKKAAEEKAAKERADKEKAAKEAEEGQVEEEKTPEKEAAEDVKKEEGGAPEKEKEGEQPEKEGEPAEKEAIEVPEKEAENEPKTDDESPAAKAAEESKETDKSKDEEKVENDNDEEQVDEESTAVEEVEKEETKLTKTIEDGEEGDEEGGE
eukprot:TRINITY_DN2841_c0_g3_i5.p1 TRINITY_DN2841_c0_g3~~TRINITY_DN2841_c0_g3_i5.p1  ORF type:complete len:486 (-),score=139.86 TRINITY_DN2841_c0_g3_i5:95-1552(-)